MPELTVGHRSLAVADLGFIVGSHRVRGFGDGSPLVGSGAKPWWRRGRKKLERFCEWVHAILNIDVPEENKKLSYCWETVRRESMPRIAKMDVEMTT